MPHWAGGCGEHTNTSSNKRRRDSRTKKQKILLQLQQKAAHPKTKMTTAKNGPISSKEWVE